MLPVTSPGTASSPTVGGRSFEWETPLRSPAGVPPSYAYRTRGRSPAYSCGARPTGRHLRRRRIIARHRNVTIQERILDVADRRIGAQEPVYIIAEIGL